MSRWICALLGVFLVGEAKALKLVEEVEPNDRPDQAQVTAGPVLLRGYFSDGDGQDAYHWRVSRQDAARPWNLRLKGIDDAITIIWFLKLEYEDAARTRVKKRTTLATFAVRPGQGPLSVSGLLFPVGEYLVGVSNLTSPAFGGEQESLAAAQELAGLGGGQGMEDFFPAPEDPEPWGRSTYELSLSAEAAPGWTALNALDAPELEPSTELHVRSSKKAVEIIVPLSQRNIDERWTLEGSGEVAKAARVELFDPTGQRLAVTKGSAGRNRFALPSLTLGKGSYRLRISTQDRRGLGRLHLRSMSVGEVVQGTEAEPNGSWALANETTLLEPLQGRVDAVRETDYFWLDISSSDGGTLQDLALSLGEGTATLCLHTAEKVRLQCAAKSTEPILPSLSLAPGRYGVSITRGSVVTDYALALRSAGSMKRRFEVEPNDIRAFANDFGRAKVVRGDLSRASDVDMHTFEVEDPDVLYRIQADGVGSLQLHDALGQKLVSASPPRGARRLRLDNLDLLPGRYWLTLSKGQQPPYRVVLRNLGPQPADFEREPNDELSSAMRLPFGEVRRGLLGSGDAQDSYVFRLDRAAEVVLRTRAPDDQALTAQLYRVQSSTASVAIGSRAHLKPAEELEYQARLEPGFYQLNLKASGAATGSHYRVSVSLASSIPASTDVEPNDWYGDSTPLLAGGRFHGKSQSMGGDDLYRAPLPTAGGHLVRVCSDETTSLIYQDFQLDEYQKPERKHEVRGRQLLVHTLSEGAETTLNVHAKSGTYDCNLYHEPLDAWRDAKPFELGEDKHVGLGSQPATVSTAFATAAEVLRIEPDDQAVRAVRVSCDSEVELRFSTAPRAYGAAVHEFSPKDSVFFLPKADSGKRPALTVQGVSEDWSQPHPVTCRMKSEAAFAPWPAMAEGTRWAIEAAELDATEARAFAATAQQVSGVVRLKSEEAAPIELELTALIEGAAWRLSGMPKRVSLTPGQVKTIPFTVTVPAGASASAPGKVRITARSQGMVRERFSDQLTLKEGANTLTQGYLVTKVPPTLLGGLDLLDHRLGARLVAVDGQSPKRPALFTQVFDGRDPVFGGAKLGTTMDFELAGGEVAPLRGFYFSLRLESRMHYWARQVAVETSTDGTQWSAAGEARLQPIAEFQYLVLPKAVSAKYVRLKVRSTFSEYRDARLSEFGAVAEPGFVPGTFESFDLASRRLGGHLVAAELPTPYAYGIADPKKTVTLRAANIPATGPSPPARHWILGFRQNRIAQIAALDWRSDPKASASYPEPTTLEVWASTTTLDAFEPLTTLTEPGLTKLNAPTAIRFLKFVVPGHANVTLPKSVGVIEAPMGDSYRSVLGLHGQDGALDTFEHAGAAGLPKRAGGRVREQAKELVLGENVESRAAFDDEQVDWFVFPAPRAAGSAVSFAVDGRDTLRQVALELFDLRGVPQTLSVRAGPPDITLAGEPPAGVVYEAARSDAKYYQAKLNAGERYYLRVSVPGRILALRAENVAAVRDRAIAIKRSLRDLANTMQAPGDALQLLRPTIYDNESGFVVGRQRMIRAINSQDLDSNGVASFADALSSTASAFKGMDGAKAMVGFATGGIFNAADDLQYADVLARSPIPFHGMFLPCNVFGCPEERRSSDLLSSAAIGSGGRFKRLFGLDDVEEALRLAVAELGTPRPYRLSSAVVKDQQVHLEATNDTAELMVVDDAQAFEAETVETPAIALVLDASGSMLKKMLQGGRRRIDVARSSLKSVIGDALPDGIQFSYSAFGFAEGSCEVRTLVPLAALDRQRAGEAVQGTPVVNLAKTAIAASIAQAGAQLAAHPGPSQLVLVTDGEETCDGDVPAAIEALKASGVAATLQIVGFAIDDPALKETFETWAELGGGQYFDATSEAELRQALSRSVDARYRVQKEGATPSERYLAANESIVLEPGSYVVTDTETQQRRIVEVRNASRTVVRF